MEDHLVAANNEYTNLLNQIQDVYYRCDKEGKLIVASRSWATLLGYDDISKCLGRNINDFYINPADRKPFLEEVYRNGKVTDYECRFRRNDGSPIVIATSSHLYYDSAGKIVGIEGTFRDITARKRAEEALQESERKFRAIFDQTFQFIGLMTPDGTLVEANRTALKFSGIQESDVLGKPFWKTPWWSHSHELQEKLRAAVKDAAQGKFVRFEATHRAADGSLHYIDFSLKPVVNEAGQVVLLIPEGRDITGRRHIEEKLQSTLQRFYQILSDMPYGILLINDKDRVEFVNQEFCDNFGLKESPADLLNLSANEMIEKNRPSYSDPDAAVARIKEIVCLGQPVNGEDIGMRNGRTYLRYFIPILIGEKQYGRLWSHIDISERKKAENALRETSQYLNNLIDFANAPIIVWDREFRIIRFNHAFELLTGMTAGEVIGQHLGALFPEKYRFASMDIIRRTTRGESLNVVEIPILKKNGDVRIVLWNSATLYESDGKTISSTIAQGQDITERKIAEAENIRAREEWEQTFNTVPDLIATLDMNHRIIRVNRAMAEQLGTTPDKCIGLICHVAVHGTSVPPAFCPHTMTCADGQQHIAEIYEPGLGGDFIVSTSPLSDKDGNLFGTVHVAHDITDRKRAEHALHVEEAKYRRIYETALEGIWGVNVGYYIVFVNPKMAELLGYPAEEILGHSVADFVAPDEKREAKQLFERHRTGLKEQFERRYIRKDGAIITLLVSASPIFGEDGTFMGSFAMFTDITERKRTEDELKQKNNDLIALNQEFTATQEELRRTNDALRVHERHLFQKNEDLSALNEKLSRHEQDLTTALTEKEVLLSEVHHRVKNNLAAFISLLSLKGSTEDTPAGKMLKQDLQNRARSMALIHETLYKTNMYDEVDMGIYLTTLLDQIANTFKTTQTVKVVVNADGVMLDIPRATPAGLIINELVTNSFKYAFPESFDVQAIRNAPPTIMIALAKTDGTYVMTVKDNGIGLSPGLDLTKMQSLGLKLVNFLAKHQMRAKIEVNSTTGAEFVFRFGEATRK